MQQVELLRDLAAGHLEAVTTVGEAFTDAVVGLGVAEAADGELVCVDGRTWRIPVDGTPVEASPSLGVPFAVSARGGIPLDVPCACPASLDDLRSAIDAVLHEADAHAVVAVRVDGTFAGVVLRSEPRQEPPFPELAVILEHEVRFAFDTWEGTLAGFRFPDSSEGDVIPGLHLHAIAAKRDSGGHVHEATLVTGAVRVWIDDLDIIAPMPAGVR